MSRRLAMLVAALALLAASLGPARAVRPDEVLADPALEERARSLSAELRCLVCQNQSIDDSDAELARDLRVLVRERLVAGDTDADVIAFVVSRYGEFVLLKPRFSARNALLWATPVVMLLAGGALILANARRRRATATVLTAEEEARIDAILKADERSKG